MSLPGYRGNDSVRTWDHWVGRWARADLVLIDPSSASSADVLRNLQGFGSVRRDVECNEGGHIGFNLCACQTY